MNKITIKCISWDNLTPTLAVYIGDWRVCIINDLTFYCSYKNKDYIDYLQKITSTVEMKDSSSDAVQIVYYSSCLSGKELTQTNKCEGLKVKDPN